MNPGFEKLGNILDYFFWHRGLHIPWTVSQPHPKVDEGDRLAYLLVRKLFSEAEANGRAA